MSILKFLAVVLLHLCSVTSGLNALAPLDELRLTEAVPYADGPRHTLDIYAPRQTRPAPVVMFFYGGGWETGEKAWYRYVGAALASRGVLVMIPDYRLYPEVKFPAFIDDAAAAVAWAHANAVRFGGDPGRIFLMGHSAGGEIATLLALDPAYLHSVGLSPERDICGVIGLAGPYDFTPIDAVAFASIFGPSADWARSMPINHVTAHSPPMLLQTGAIDRVVEPGNTARMATRLRAAGVDVIEHTYPNIGHTALIVAFSSVLAFLAPDRDATLLFIQGHNACSHYDAPIIPGP